jgi:hypothetical protein
METPLKIWLDRLEWLVYMNDLHLLLLMVPQNQEIFFERFLGRCNYHGLFNGPAHTFVLLTQLTISYEFFNITFKSFPLMM